MENKRKKLSFYFIAFLAIAFVFLAIGLGTLGSVATTGKSYELMTKTKDGEDPSVVFHLKNPTEKDKDGKETSVSCVLRHVYLNVGALYSEEGKDVEICLTRGSSNNPNSSSSTFQHKAKLENLVPEPVEKEQESTAIQSAQFNWIAPFDAQLPVEIGTSIRVDTRGYMKLTASHNLIINEVVFVGEKLTDALEGTGEYTILPVEIESATPYNGQSREEAKEAAAALIDAQRIPNLAQSSFNRFTKEETYSMMSIAEMRAGGGYTEGNVYHGDTVYNSFGTSILAFGTRIFGMSPFGLRFFPMLASFGVLVLGFFFAKDLFKSEKAGLAFAILYALSTLSLGLGHLGSPLMLGVFFFTGSAFGCYKFYRYGLKKGNLKDALPLVLSGLGGAAAICVNSAFLIPMLAVAGLFAAGMVKQQYARRYYLDLAIAEAEAEEAQSEKPVHEKTETAQEPAMSEGRAKVAKVVSEYRRKNTLAPVAFFTSVVIGALFLSLIFLIPTYYLAVKLFDDPASPSLNIFTLAAKFFAGGFVGTNGEACAWTVAYTTFIGTGSPYAITSVVVNAFAGIAALIGIAYAISRIALICKARDWEKKSELYKMIILLSGLVICLVTAAFAKGAVAFMMLAYIFAFLLAAGAVKHYTEAEGKIGGAARIISIVGLVLLALWFALTAVFTFSIPLPASFMKLFV